MMEKTEKTENMEKKEKEKEIRRGKTRYTRAQILGAAKYAARRDALAAILETDADKEKSYALEEIEGLLDGFMKRRAE